MTSAERSRLSAQKRIKLRLAKDLIAAKTVRIVGVNHSIANVALKVITPNILRQCIVCGKEPMEFEFDELWRS
jgi:hypothetical protein